MAPPVSLLTSPLAFVIGMPVASRSRLELYIIVKRTVVHRRLRPLEPVLSEGHSFESDQEPRTARLKEIAMVAQARAQDANAPINLDAGVVEAAEAALAAIGAARSEIGQVIFGQQKVVDLSLITLLAGGHGLLVGVPGLAKTKLVEAMGIVLGLSARRVQFTPDLMPSDILGSEVLDESTEGKRHFRFIKGPVFAQLLMADEINRASPRTQSALLQAMQEHHVTVAGERHDLPAPFHVLATQNPIEQEGTYPLPEAQLDRFLLEIDVGYPDREAERRILLETTGSAEHKPVQAMTAETLMSTQRLVRRLPVGEAVVDAILDLVRSARPGEGEKAITDKLAWGPGPRASQALTLAARARALVEGRLAPSIDDVAALAAPVLKHRIALTFAARADGETVEGVVARLVERLG
jgi:MoxR-like ATPase